MSDPTRLLTMAGRQAVEDLSGPLAAAAIAAGVADVEWYVRRIEAEAMSMNETKTVLIEVTQDDIDKGRPGEVDRCPIAIAAQRALGIPDVWVTPFGRILPGPDANWLMPASAQRFVRRFDQGKTVTPFRFRQSVS